MKKLFSLFAAVLFAGSMFAAEAVYKQTIFNATNNSGKVSSYENEWTNTTDGFTVNIVNANNNNNGWELIKMGRKNVESVGSVATATAIDKAVTKVVVNIDAVTVSKINSFKLFVSENGTDWSEKGAFTVATGNQEVAIAGADQAENLFYKVVADCASGSSNGLIAIAKIEFYAEKSGDEPEPDVANFCKTEITHFNNPAEEASAVLLSVGVKGSKTIVRVDKKNAEAKNLDFLQVTNHGNIGSHVDEGGSEALAIEFDTPALVDDSLTLEILWSVVGFPGNWMVQNLRVANADCESAVVPLVPVTCAEVYSMAKNDKVALADVVVTYVDNKKVYVRDESAALLLFLPANATWKVGDVLAGVEGVVDIYNGIYQVAQSAAQVAAVVVTAGEAPAPAELTSIDKDADMSKLVLLKGIEVEGEFVEGTASNINITLGEDTYVLRSQFKNAFKFEAGKKYDITALVTLYQNAVQLYFISAVAQTGTAIDNTAVEAKTVKAIRNGQVVIIRDGKVLNMLGVEMR